MEIGQIGDAVREGRPACSDLRDVPPRAARIDRVSRPTSRGHLARAQVGPDQSSDFRVRGKYFL